MPTEFIKTEPRKFYKCDLCGAEHADSYDASACEKSCKQKLNKMSCDHNFDYYLTMNEADYFSAELEICKECIRCGLKSDVFLIGLDDISEEELKRLWKSSGGGKNEAL